MQWLILNIQMLRRVEKDNRPADGLRVKADTYELLAGDHSFEWYWVLLYAWNICSVCLYVREWLLYSWQGSKYICHPDILKSSLQKLYDRHHEHIHIQIISTCVKPQLMVFIYMFFSHNITLKRHKCQLSKLRR